MNAIDTLLNDEPRKWIDALEVYQKNVISELLETGDPPSVVAEKWLGYATANTYRFGVQKTSAILLENTKKEILKFLCGAPEYEQDRKDLAKSRDPTRDYTIGLISSAIAVKVGMSYVFLAPVVAVLLFSFGKCTLNAICSTFTQSREDG